MPVHCGDARLHHISVWEPGDEDILKHEHIEYAKNGNIIYYENHDVEIERTVMDLTGIKINCFHWTNDPSDTLLDGIVLKNERIVKSMIHAGADITALDNKAFIFAAQAGSVKLMNLLITHGADVHAQKDEALFVATIRGNLEAVKLLLKYNPSWDSVSNACRESTVYYRGEVSEYLRDHLKKMRPEKP